MHVPLTLPLTRPAGDIAITQPFGVNAAAYAPFGFQGHNGLDLAAEEGELVVAVDGGRVMEVRFDPCGYGVTVRLAHDWGESRYAHGQPYSVPVEFELGHTVRRGERVFLAGSTGSTATAGVHLHFGLRLRRPDGSLDYTNANGFGGYDDPLPLLAGLCPLGGGPPRSLGTNHPAPNTTK